MIQPREPFDRFHRKLTEWVNDLEPEEGCSWIRCELCAGTGEMPEDPEGKRDTCPDCRGLGNLKINWKEEADNRRIDDSRGK